LAVESRRLPDGQQRVRPLVVVLSPARNGDRGEALPGPVESAFLTLQAVENLRLPALSDPWIPAEVRFTKP